MKIRIFPVLLLREFDFVKSFQYDKFMYLGDPINVIKIFNEKFIDELVILNITYKNFIDYAFLSDLFSEAFVPISYGGGLTDHDDIKKVLDLGIERVILNAEKFKETDFLSDSVANFGSSTICAKIDVGNTYRHATAPEQLWDRISWCIDQGVSEIIVQSILRDGTQSGLDPDILKVVKEFQNQVSVVVAGGVSTLNSLRAQALGELGGIGASSLFVFAPSSRSVLINNPCFDYSEINHDFDV
jgi:cyclase